MSPPYRPRWTGGAVRMKSAPRGGARRPELGASPIYAVHIALHFPGKPPSPIEMRETYSPCVLCRGIARSRSAAAAAYCLRSHRRRWLVRSAAFTVIDCTPAARHRRLSRERRGKGPSSCSTHCTRLSDDSCREVRADSWLPSGASAVSLKFQGAAPTASTSATCGAS